jgi:hypothetical protein
MYTFKVSETKRLGDKSSKTGREICQISSKSALEMPL